MIYKWKILKVSDSQKASDLAREMGIHDIIAQLLINRGADSPEKVKKFFYPSLNDQYDPFLMSGMNLAVERAIRALERDEKIMVYGDYDVDGTTGAALLYMFFRELGADVDYYIPDRLKEGYGISVSGINYALRNGCTLMVSVDCGVAASKEILYGKNRGLETIVCDHHEVDALPEAVAVLDPIKPGCTYPFKYLSGCGVAYKFAKATSIQLGKPDLPDKYLDLVAIAAAADVVPLIDENRILVQAGFKAIAEQPRAGIKALMRSSHVDHRKLTTGQVSFIIAPKINAVGRLGDARRAVELLVTDNEEVAEDFAQVLENENSHRRMLDERTFLEAQELANELVSIRNRNSLVLHKPNWHPGVIGIVAARIVEQYYRPTIMLATNDGVIKGSARSIVGYDIFEAIKACGDLLIQFGGHKYAAGLSMNPENLDAFVEAFEGVVSSTLDDELKTPVLEIDALLDLNTINAEFMNMLKQFEPFGPQNPRPTFLSRGLFLSDARMLNGSHLKMKVKVNGVTYDAIKFRNGESNVGVGDYLDMVYSLDENHYAGNIFYQLQVKDYKKTK
ncbi:MAG: single-stranded-DNA-specific exonuclease RecJ [Candidatus Kryptoniota bacterium]